MKIIYEGGLILTSTIEIVKARYSGISLQTLYTFYLNPPFFKWQKHDDKRIKLYRYMLQTSMRKINKLTLNQL